MINMLELPYSALFALAAINFVLCTGIGWACLCRISAMSEKTTKANWRAGYALMMAAATTSGLSPLLWQEWPGPGQIGMALAVLYVLGWGAANWRRGPPDYARKPPQELRTDDLPGVVGGRGQ